MMKMKNPEMGEGKVKLWVDKMLEVLGMGLPDVKVLGGFEVQRGGTV